MTRKSLLSLACALVLLALVHILVHAAVMNARYHRYELLPTQKAEELAYAIGKGTAPETLLPSSDPGIFNTPLLSAFVLDSTGGVLAANTQVARRLKPVPVGLLPHARKLGLKQVIWQPWPGLQKSLAIRYVPGRNVYVAVAGAYDDRVDESMAGAHAFAGLASLALLVLYAVLSRRYQKP